MRCMMIRHFSISMTMALPASGAELFWLVVALFGPLLWMPIRSYIIKRRRLRRNSTFISGGPHGNQQDGDAPKFESEGLVVWLWNCWNTIVPLIIHWYYTISNALKRPRNQNRVTFAEHSTGQVRAERYHFDRHSAPAEPVIPEIRTPSPVAQKRSEQPKPRLAPNTPPPKSFRKKKASAALERKEPTTMTTVSPNKATPTSPQDHRSLAIQQYQTSPFMARSVRAIQVSMTPLSVQYQRQQSNRKRRHDDSIQLVEEEIGSTIKRPRLPLRSSTQQNTGRLPLRRSSLSKKRNRASTEAWLLEEFNRKRPEKKQALERPTTTNATETFPASTLTTPLLSDTANSESKPAFSFDAESAADKKEDTAQPAAAFAFGASQASAATNATNATTSTDTKLADTKVPATTEAATTAPVQATMGGGFTFGQQSATEDAKPPASTTAASAPAPATSGFTFGQTSSESTANKPPAANALAPATGFSFGQTTSQDYKPLATQTPATGGFSFGQVSGDSSSKPPTTIPAQTPATGGFTFGQNAASADSKPSTSNGTTTLPSSFQPTFSFGAAATPNVPVTKSNQPIQAAAPPETSTFTFGANTPAAATPAPANTPSFSFGGTSGPPAAPSFGTNQPTAPSFGAPVAPSFGGITPAIRGATLSAGASARRRAKRQGGRRR